MSSKLLNEQEIKDYAQAVRTESFCLIPGILPADTLDRWHAAFLPLLQRHIEREGQRLNRGPGRYYVTLPFTEPFADPQVFENDTIMAIVEELVGSDGVMCQLATDTPVEGSQYQEVHRDTPPLFPETGQETPPFQLAVNFPLVDVTPQNGPIEIAPRTHLLPKEDGLRRITSGEIKLEQVYMKKGDVMIRDVRHLHRGTPNPSGIARPMVVIGYSRRWLFRPEVSIRIPRVTWEKLSERGRFWLRFNPRVEELDPNGEETYQSFAY